MLTISSAELNSPRTNDLNNSKCISTIDSCLKTCCLCLNACKDNVDNVRLLTLNCCGIKTKLYYPEFIEMINDFDILYLVETKTDDCDIINIPPENSKYASIDALGEIENEFQNIINIFVYMVILIAGLQKNPILLILKENQVTMRMLNIYL